MENKTACRSKYEDTRTGGLLLERVSQRVSRHVLLIRRRELTRIKALSQDSSFLFDFALRISEQKCEVT